MQFDLEQYQTLSSMWATQTHHFILFGPGEVPGAGQAFTHLQGPQQFVGKGEMNGRPRLAEKDVFPHSPLLWLYPEATRPHSATS